MKYILSFCIISIAKISYGVCPACAVAAGFGIGVSSYFNLDILIIGLWIGALSFGSSIWCTNKVMKIVKLRSNLSFFMIRNIFIILHIFFILPVYKSGKIIYKFFTIFGIDRMLFGILIAIPISSIVGSLYLVMKKNHNNKPYFPYQKIVMQLLTLILISLIIHFNKF